MANRTSRITYGQSLVLGSPRPANQSNENNLTKLKQEVKRQNADFGFAFDGDGDRIGVVNNNLKLISGDILTTFLAQSISEKK